MLFLAAIAWLPWAFKVDATGIFKGLGKDFNLNLLFAKQTVKLDDLPNCIE
jgi:hypothetical protein